MKLYLSVFTLLLVFYSHVFAMQEDIDFLLLPHFNFVSWIDGKEGKKIKFSQEADLKEKLEIAFFKVYSQTSPVIKELAGKEMPLDDAIEKVQNSYNEHMANVYQASKDRPWFLPVLRSHNAHKFDFYTAYLGNSDEVVKKLGEFGIIKPEEKSRGERLKELGLFIKEKSDDNQMSSDSSQLNSVKTSYEESPSAHTRESFSYMNYLSALFINFWQ